MLVNGNSERIPLADGSVQCVVTSPPYWGLRDYGLPPSVWDGEVDCRHAWGEEKEKTTGRKDRERLAKGCGNGHGGGLDANNIGKQQAGTGQFCRRCNAWRGALGLEPKIELYVAHLVQTFREIRRVLRDDGTCWLNLGDSYAGSWGNFGARNGNQRSRIAERWHRPAYEDERYGNDGFPPTANVPGLKPKDQCLIPHRVALALQEDGWWLRSTIVWAKPNPMPESVTDRPTTAHEYVFLLTKKPKYFYDAEAVREAKRSGPSDIKKMKEKKDRLGGKNSTAIDPLLAASSLTHVGEKRAVGDPESGRNLRTVWNIATESYSGAHYATFPTKLVEPCIKAGTSQRGCCPACGAGWVREVELTPEYQELLESGKAWRDQSGKPNEDTNRQQKGHPSNVPTKNKTTGWRPACDCDAGDPVPAIVLDPFCGSGTVGEVCRGLRRRFVGIDLSAEYLAYNALPRAERKTAAAALGELPLFEGIGF